MEFYLALKYNISNINQWYYDIKQKYDISNIVFTNNNNYYYFVWIYITDNRNLLIILYLYAYK